jgi:N-acetyl-beta-hexosaminidase
MPPKIMKRIGTILLAAGFLALPVLAASETDSPLPLVAQSRACALAEVAWTQKSLKDWTSFRQRLEIHLRRLAAQGANFRPLDKPVPTGTVKAAGENHYKITIKRVEPK